MAKQPRDLYHGPFHDHQRSFFASSSTSSINVNNDHIDHPSPYIMSFTESLHGSTDYNTLSKAFNLLSEESLSTPKDDRKPKIETTGEYSPVLTPNSSVFSSSTEAGDDEEGNNISKKEKQSKGEGEDGNYTGESSKKLNKVVKKKVEKKEKEARFAFMTKSEVDHLEDGYRWRKYGQKAVKNSPYPRNYYRCTTQKCTVKKRVERSFQDPSVVITTYEGTHNHHLPATLRGNVAGMFHHSILNPAQLGGSNPNFPYHQEFFVQMPTMTYPLYNYGGGGGGGESGTGSNINYHHQHQQNNVTPLQLPDYGLLQDIVPSMDFKQER